MYSKAMLASCILGSPSERVTGSEGIGGAMSMVNAGR
jgi:hypothetical protein